MLRAPSAARWRGLARAGARVAVLGRRRGRAERVVRQISETGGHATALTADVLKRGELEATRDALLSRWGRLDVLVNAAGGNVPAATLGEERAFFDLPEDAFREVLDLNLLGTLIPSQVFGEAMAGAGDSSIVNVSSMAAGRPLTKVVGYSAAKAGVENLTRWLAVELARRYGPGLRVNAIAPGFFLGEQNRALLVREDGTPTERGRRIIEHTPAGRFGDPEELVGTIVWLCGPGVRFVNRAVVSVDSGFGAYAGV